MKHVTRRTFLKKSVLTSSASALTFSSLGSRILGANDTLRVGVVGFHSRGKSHIKGFSSLPGVKIGALCDCDGEILKKQAEDLKKDGTVVEQYSDYRKLLENPAIDIISIATPNHTHSLIAIEALQAGKDVYVEKPVSHNVWEGRQLVEATRKYGRIVQAGTQCRSNPGMIEAIDYIQKGNLGKIKIVRGFCYKRRKSIGKVSGPQTVPNSVDYDLWCGPSPKGPLMRQQLHYDWHWVWATGNGDLGNQGIHQMDICRWVLGVHEVSPRIMSVGARLGYVDDGETANTQIILHDYEKAPLIFEVRGLGIYDGQDERPNYRGVTVGVVVDCEEGSVVIPSYYSAVVYDRQSKVVKEFDEEGDHYANFVDAVRSRKRENLHGDIVEGHLSSALCHTGNISHMIGKPASHGAIMDLLRSDGYMADGLGRMAEHLAVNNVDLNKTPLTLGRVLKMDPKTERFIGDEEANRLLTRDYRSPFVVPKLV